MFFSQFCQKIPGQRHAPLFQRLSNNRVPVMHITIMLFASFRYGRFKSEVRSYTVPITIRDIAADLGIPVQDLGIILRNGIHASPDDAVEDGDTISLMPQIGGG